MMKITFQTIVVLVVWTIVMLPSWYPESVVYKAGKYIKDTNPMYKWADWWTTITVILLIVGAGEYLWIMTGKLYDWIIKQELKKQSQ